MANLELGTKIRQYRKDQGLSMQALADKVGITPSMLSQIERDLANPSINTLQLISSALNVPLFHFFTGTGGPEEEYVVRRDNRRRISKSGSTMSYEYELLMPNTNGSIEFLMQHFKPGCNSGEAVQTHDAEEIGYVLEGQLNLFIDNSEVQLNAGDSVRIPNMTPHCWYNRSDKDATLLFAMTPPVF